MSAPLQPHDMGHILANYADRLRTKTDAGKRMIYCQVRRRWLVLTPEEMVRQLVIAWLVAEGGYPLARISVEKELIIYGLKKRYDILVFNSAHQTWLLVECKAPHIPIAQTVFDQIARYNIALRVPFLLVTNGSVAYSCQIDWEKGNYFFLTELPSDG